MLRFELQVGVVVKVFGIYSVMLDLVIEGELLECRVEFRKVVYRELQNRNVEQLQDKTCIRLKMSLDRYIKH